jgi:hypothetical protein
MQRILMPVRSWRVATVAACLLAVAVLAFAWTFGARSAGGADALGYVSQAYLWLDGEVWIDNGLARAVPWPNAPESLTPLGYRPRDSTASVPTYSPGVPLIMAAFAFFGACGPYLVVPVFGGLLVAATFVLGMRLTNQPGAALIAAVLMATSPAFLVNVIVPMSDTVTTALWALSLCALTWPGLRAASIGGFAAGLAVLARPNLAPLALAGVLAAEMWRADMMKRGARSAAYLAFVLPAALFIATLNAQLYGSPFRSGYGASSDLYALRHLVRNGYQFGTWLLESEWTALLLLLPLLAGRFRSPIRWMTSGPLLLFAVLLLGAYLFYQPFDAWWFLRFLLPGYPLMFLAIAVVANRAALAWPYRGVLLPIGILLVAVRVIPYSNEILTIGPGEERYTAITEFITRGLPANAVFISMQHSGTIRFYAGRQVVRYDWISAERFPSMIVWLRDHGYRPYIVLDSWEEPRFRARFAGTGPAGRLALFPVAVLRGAIDVRIYDASVPVEGTLPTAFRLEFRGRQCVRPAPYWRVPSLGSR